MLGFSSVTALLLANLIITLGSALQSSVGFGLALLSAPILALVEPRLVPAPLILAVTLLLLLTALRERQSMDLRGLGWILCGRAPGTVLGATALDALTTRGLRVVLGALVLLAVGISLLRVRLTRTRPLLVLAGFASGVMGTTAALGGPAVAVLYQDDPGDRVRATLAAFFLIGAVMSLSALWYIGRLGKPEVGLALGILPGMVLGFVSSSRSSAWLDRGRTRAAVLIIAGVSGAASVLSGLLGWS